MKFTKEKRNGFLVLLIAQILLAITVLAFSDSLWLSVLGVSLIILPVLLLLIFWKNFYDIEKQIKKEKLRSRDFEIISIDTLLNLDQLKEILIKKSYTQNDLFEMNTIIFKRKKRYFMFCLSDNIRSSFEYAYDYYVKNKNKLKIMEFNPVIFVSDLDAKDLSLIHEYFIKEQTDSIEAENFTEYLSEDGSGYSNISLFIPMVYSANKIYYIKNAQSNDILRSLSIR